LAVNKLTGEEIFYYSSRKRQNGKMGTMKKTVEVIPSKERDIKTWL
jgi:hypothetical protein